MTVNKNELKLWIENHVDQYLKVIRKVGLTVKQEKYDIYQWVGLVTNLLIELKTNNGKLFLIGNGASCSIASHFAADFTKNGRLNSFSNNEGTLLTTFSNDFSFETAYLEILKRHMDDGDGLIAISSSGNSRNILNAVNLIRNEYKKSPLITYTGFSPENPIRKTGNYNLYLDSYDYGFVESGHSYYLHMLLDNFIKVNKE